MSNKKADHVIFRNEKLFCSHCGATQTIPLPMEIAVFAAMGKAFTKSHSKCEKTYQEPVVDGSLSETAKAHFWWNRGEKGISSECIYNTIMGLPKGRWGAMTPSDPDDFRRCYLLLKTVPEWKAKLYLLKPLSETWSNLVDNWDKLTEMLEDLMVKKKDNGMYDFMKKLGC
jgi:hypothetical protein